MYRQAGFTDDALRELYTSAVQKPTTDDAYLRSRFGAPLKAVTQKKYGIANVGVGDEAAPYEFLAGRGALRSYNDLGKKAHYVDNEGRQYFCVGSSAPNELHCRIPRSITTAENRQGLRGMDRIDFPRQHEFLTLTASLAFPSEDRAQKPPIEVQVIARLGQKDATCLIRVSEDVGAPPGLDVGGGVDESEEALARAQAQREKIMKNLDKIAEKQEEQLREEHYSFSNEVESLPERRYNPTAKRPNSSSAQIKTKRSVMGVVKKSASAKKPRVGKC